MAQPVQKPLTTKAFTLDDGIYMVSKHKWLISLLSLAGLGAAAAVYLKKIPLYQSESRLLIRYVLERENSDTYQAHQGLGNQVRDNVINTEIEILTSHDLAFDVVRKMGVRTILPQSQGAVSPSDAAGVICEGLQVTTGQSSNVIYVSYSNPHPELSRRILSEVIDRYFQRHLEVHRSAAAFEVVTSQVDTSRKSLNQTEDELNRLRTSTGVMSLADAIGALTSQRTLTQEELLKTRAALAEKLATYNETENIPLVNGTEGFELRPTEPPQAPKNGIGDSLDRANEVPAYVMAEYRSIHEILSFLRKREIDLRIRFKSGNRLLELNQQQILSNDARRTDLEQKYAGLLDESEKITAGDQEPGKQRILEKAALAASHAKIEVLTAHLIEIATQFSREYAVGVRIEELVRKRDIEATDLRMLETHLKNAKIDQALDPSRMPNIAIVQQPSEPVEVIDPATKKIVIGLAASGIGLGLGIAFIIELLFDRRIRRPIEIQSRLQIPLLLSIPYMKIKYQRGAITSDTTTISQEVGQRRHLCNLDAKRVRENIASRQVSSLMLYYFETIRDRIIFNFQVNNVIHRPKLVAVTGLTNGAGASTIATGLARSLAEIRGSKVLLVDLSGAPLGEDYSGVSSQTNSLEVALQIASEPGFRDNGESFYRAVSTSSVAGHRITGFSSVQLHELIPKLQESEFDYVVFDLQTVNQTSRTITMAGMMDKLLLVLDAENTTRELLTWGYTELVRAQSDVSCVFNKSRSSLPGSLIGSN
jgi:uncharacterized protein involved in exopolysaccharide biosynthesis